MACNCKRANKLQDDYGVKEDETLSGKAYRYLWKVIIALLMLAFSIVIVPIVIVMAMYNIVFGNGKPIVLPKFLGKYLE